MRKITGGLGISLAIIAISVGCASAGGGKQARYPKELIGVWHTGVDDCKLPGDLDSDGRIEIKPDKLVGYEHWSQPRSVVLISNEPRAWRVKTRLHINGDVSDLYEIYSLIGNGSDAMALVDTSRAIVYIRCR